MSAYMVDKEHIDVLVSLALEGPSGVPVSPGTAWYPLAWWAAEADETHRVADDADATGSMLIAANLESIHARYPDTVTDPHNIPGPNFTYWEVPYRFEDPRVRLSLVEGLRAIQCYEYQSCEHGGWRTSEASAFCDMLRSALVDRLPGMEDAPWNWTAETIAERRGVRS